MLFFKSWYGIHSTHTQKYGEMGEARVQSEVEDEDLSEKHTFDPSHEPHREGGGIRLGLAESETIISS